VLLRGLREPAANFIGVFTQKRRRQLVPQLRVAEVDRITNERDFSFTLAYGHTRLKPKSLREFDTVSN